MGQVDRHLETVSYKGAGDSITNAHLEHGTITGVTATGRYKTLTGFTGVPDVVVTGEDGNARLAQAPVAGSFKCELDAGGTANAQFIAWGAR